MDQNSIDKLLEYAAEFGDFNFFRRINKRTVESLSKNGFVLKQMGASRSWPKLHEISWKSAKVTPEEGKTVCEIDLSSPELTQAQRLWVIATKANLKEQQKRKNTDKKTVFGYDNTFF